jgi:hypothetical protein
MTYFRVMLGSALGWGARYFASGPAAQHIGETLPFAVRSVVLCLLAVCAGCASARALKKLRGT